MKIDGRLISLRDMVAADFALYWHWLQPGHRWQDFDGPYYRKTEEEQRRSFEDRKQKVLAGSFSSPRVSLIIADRQTDRLIGIVSSYWRSIETNWLCAGITIFDDSLWNKGMGVEALALWTHYLFEAHPKICRLGLETWSGNEGLMRLAEKLGFLEEARFRKARIVNDVHYDSLGFGILREEWGARR